MNRGTSGGTGKISTSGRLVLTETADGFRVFDVIGNTTPLSKTLAMESLEMLINGNFPRGGQFNRVRLPRKVAPLRPDHLAYIQGNQLVVLDPLTDREHWTRTLEGTEGELISDAEFVVAQVAAPNATRPLRVFRVSDGRLVRRTQIPVGAQVILQYRHDVQRLLRIPGKETVEIGLFHPAREAWTWRKEFPEKTLFAVLDGRFVAAIEVSGRFSVLSDVDGRPLVTSQLDVAEEPHGLHVFQDASRMYVTLVLSPEIEGLSVPQLVPRPVASARLFGVNREDGQKLWSRDFTQLTLQTSQPGFWPFLLVSAAGEPDGANNASPLPTLAYLLDRATGKTLHAAEVSGATNAHRGWKVDQTTGAVSIKVGGTGLQVSPRMEDANPPPPPVARPAS
jgi:hypothetical protein